MYCVSAWSSVICPVVPACLGTMTLPFVQETSYSMLKPPLADGGDQARMAIGGMPLTRVSASGGPGQSVACNNTQAHHSSLGVCDYQNMWYHDFADYCLESITINRLIGDLDNSAANKTILLLQVLK